jgi:3-hydroxyethyl bacteriochlorophyllide a dehydrogenase
VSGDAGNLDQLISRLAPGGEVILAGFYSEPIQFQFPLAFMKEARMRISAEWKPDDMAAVQALVDMGRLDLGGLISHQVSAGQAKTAYASAFSDPDCLKMVLDWRDIQ